MARLFITEHFTRIHCSVGRKEVKKIIKLIYVALFAVEALTALTVLVVGSMRLERHSLYLCICICLTVSAFIVVFLIINATIDLVLTKARNKKICSTAASLVTSQKNYARFISLLSQALLVDEKIVGKSKLFIKKIKQQTDALSDGLRAAADSIKRLS